MGAEVLGPLVLNPNVVISPVSALPEVLRMGMEGSDEDRIVSQRGSRTRSQRISQDAAAFIERFRKPVTLVEAVLSHCADLDSDPEETLEGVYPLFASFRSEGLLVDPNDDAVRLCERLFDDGALVHGYRILECVRPLADTEVYKAVRPDGTTVALKLLRSDAPRFVREAFVHEWKVLHYIAERNIAPIPGLIGGSVEEPEMFMVLEWREGRTADEVAFRTQRDATERSRIARNLVNAFCALHAVGVWHGDVQPRNILIGEDGVVSLLDFGGATLVGANPAPARVGMLPYYEPELARSFLLEQPPAPVSERGEQYNVAALVYAILTGSSCLPLALETDRALRQIVEHTPRSLQDTGITWPELETVLHKALSKDPDQRFVSLDEFAHRLFAVLDDAGPKMVRSVVPPFELPVVPLKRTGPDPVEAGFRYIVTHYGLHGHITHVGLSRGPKASLYYGAAGIAYSLLRLSILSDDPGLLAAADVWITRAISMRKDPDAFFADEVGMKQGMAGPYSLFSSASGLFLVNAWIKHCGHDNGGRDRSILRFVDEAALALHRSDHQLDLMNGAAGLLFGCALLLPVCDQPAIRAQLLSLGERLAEKVRSELDGITVESEGPTNSYLGFAHGRSGALFALLKWADAASQPLCDRVDLHLNALLSHSTLSSAGRSWPVDVAIPGSEHWTGWCHGSAGHILLWLAAWRSSANKDHLLAAKQAGHYLWNARAGAGMSLCCGSSGAALSFAHLANCTGDDQWLSRGAELMSSAMSSKESPIAPDSLFRGHLGVCLAAVELAHPKSSVWPFCGFPC